ncbi:pentapeptide repeat-containing protein, partial [Paraburkholderia sp. RL17-373-BIF-A]|uniref:pentapeptide repeat-containing protein n=1 Tax=Paraburkholderia sp. RL17-373-BIF-A TaxID=3031629 RepID=UPI0038B8425A
MPVVTAQTFARAFFGKGHVDGQAICFAGGTHEAFRRGANGKSVPTFSREVFRRVTDNAEESMGKLAGDFDISCSRGTVTATITLLTAFIGLLIERVCKSISSHQKEDAVTHAVVDLHERILSGESGNAFLSKGPGNRSVSIGLKHGGELEVSEDTDENGTVLTITVRTGATSESFAIKDGTIDDLRAVLEQDIVRHEADHHLYGEAVKRIPGVKQVLLRGGKLDLKGENLSGMDLSGMDLREAKLSGAELFEANLSRAKLSQAKLSGANLSRANLSGADLRWADLRGANLSGANLSGADLREANLSGANLSGAKLSGAALSGANLSGANLRGANLILANLREANLRGADLSRAEVRGANLSGATLHQTTFSLGALLHYSHQFTDEMLSGIVFAGLSEDLGRSEIRDILFNHRNNPQSGSILTAIDSRLKGENKLRCMELAIKALDDAMNAGVRDPDVDAVVTEFLFGHPEYQQSDVIQSFVQKAVGRLFLSSRDVSLTLDGWSSHGLGIMLDHAQAQLAQPAPGGYAWARANGFGLLQILEAAGQHPELREKAMALRKHYLGVLPATLVQFAESNAQDIGEEPTYYFPLIARDREVCLLVSSDDYGNGMRAPGEPGDNLGSLYVTADWSRENVPRHEAYPVYTTDHLAQFPVLQARSIARAANQALENMVKCLLPPVYVGGYLLGSSSGAKQDWTTASIQRDLKLFIMPLIGRDPDPDVIVTYGAFSDVRVSEDTLKQLFTEAEKVHGPMNDVERSFYLRTQAAALSYASSTKLFGKEVDSPEALRALAAAMLNAADDLDPG